MKEKKAALDKLKIHPIKELARKCPNKITDPVSLDLENSFLCDIKKDEMENTSDMVKRILSLDKGTKKEQVKHRIRTLIGGFKQKDQDTGSCEVQGFFFFLFDSILSLSIYSFFSFCIFH